MADDSRKTELLVGLFLLVGLLLLGILILQFSRVREALKDKYAISVTFPNAAGLVEGAPVKLGGATIGEVAKMPRLNDTFNGVIIDLKIFSEYQVPEGSTFLIGSSGLMGDKLLEIRPPEPHELTGEHLAEDSMHLGSGASGLGAIEDAAVNLTAKTEKVLGDVEVALEKLTSAVSNLDSGFLGDENAEHFSKTLEDLSTAIAKLDSEVLGEENLANVTDTIAGFKETAENIRKGSESLGPSMEKVGETLEKLEPSIGKVETALDKFGSAADSIKTTADRATGTIGEFTEGEGLLPALVGDERLKQEFSGLISNLKRHGILRYKNTASTENPFLPEAESKPKPHPGRATPREDDGKRGWFPIFREKD